MSDFVFLYPYWLIGLLPVAGLLAWLANRQKQQRLIAPHIAQAMGLVNHQTSSQKLLLLGLSWTLAIFTLAGPSFEQQARPVYHESSARVLVMDMSRSMYATDNQPNRLTQARYKAADLLKQWHEGVTGLVAYAADAYTISPMTTDTATIQNLLPNLSPDIMPYQGANAVKGVKMAIQMMKDAGLNEGAIVLITDDIDQQEHDGIEKLIKGSHWHLAILGMGSLAGAPIPLQNGSLLQTTQGQTVIAKSGFDAMKSLAQVVDGTFISVQLTNQDVKTILRATKPGAFSTSSTLSKNQQQVKDRVNNGYWLIPFLLIPALLLFRRGLIFCVFGCGLSMLSAPHVQASPWLTPDQEAKQQFDMKDYQQAAKNFIDPAWKGAAYYNAGDYQQAITTLSSIAHPTPKQQYNLANAYAKHGDLQKAIDLYEQVLKATPNDRDAQYNLDVVKKALKQQQQQQQQQQKNKQNSKNDKSSQPNKHSSSQQHPSTQQKNKQQNQSDQQKGQQSKQQPNQSEQQQGQQAHKDQQSSKSDPSDKKQSAAAQKKATQQKTPDKEKSSTSSQNQQKPPSPEQTDVSAVRQQDQNKQADPELRKLEQVEDARDPSRLLRAQLLLQAQHKAPPEDNGKAW